MKKFYFFLVALVLGVVSASAVDYYLIGGFNGWVEKDPSAKFTASGNGEYVLDYQGELTSGFKVNDGTWTNDAINFGSNGSTLILGVPYSYGVGGSTSNINLEEGAVSNPHIVLNPAAGTLTITGEEAEVKITYVLWGNFFDGTAVEWNAIDLEDKGNNLWAADNVVLTGTCEFGVRQNTNGSQSDWFAAAGASAITANGGVFPCTNSNGVNFTIAAETYNISFNADTLELTVALSSASVEGIEIEENVAPVYYNLQGVRVAEPANGLYIVVRGDKVAKEIVK